MTVKHSEGYLTVYLSITLALILSLCLALIEGVRSNGVRVEAECVTEIGINSVLAEYHRELFRQYNIFAVDSSYGGISSGPNPVAEHLRGYVERNLSLEDIFLADYLYRDFLAMELVNSEVTGVSILTDSKGEVFRNRAVEAPLTSASFSPATEQKSQ